MLIINIISFIFTVYSITNIITVASIISTKSKRGIVHTRHDIHNNYEQSKGIQSTPRISVHEDVNSRSLPYYRNAKRLNTQRVSHTNSNRGSHAYGRVPKRPFSYAPSSVHQTKSHQNAPYFNILNNPSIYTVPTGSEKPLDASKSIVSQSQQKLQEIYSPSSNEFYQEKTRELQDFSDSDYPSYSSISKIIAQGIENDASSPILQMPLYKTNYPLSKVIEYTNTYAPSFPTVSSDKTQSFKHNNEAAIDPNAKKVLVPIIQFQSNPNFSGVLSSYENSPFLLSANYPIKSDLGLNIEVRPKFNMPVQSKNPAPFSSPLSSFQGQIVPIHAAGSTPHFPQYKGASIEVYPVPSNVPKVQGGYQHLHSQPQLHFGKQHSDELGNVQHNSVYPSISTEGILEDVEIINKKKPEPHPSQTDNDDNEEDEGYNGSGKDDGQSSEDDDDGEHEPRKYFQEPPTEGDFQPSTFPFKEYDETFGKYRTPINDEETDDKSHSTYKNYPSSGNDEEEENSSTGYRVEDNESPESLYNSYEEEDEEKEENRKHEKREQNDKDSSEIEEEHFKYYQKDFDREFEEFFKKELPKRKYAQTEETSEIDNYYNPKVSERQTKDDKPFYENQKQSAEYKKQGLHPLRKYPKISKTDYKESDIYSKTPKAIYEETSAYKNPKTGKYSKHSKPKDEIEKRSHVKQLSKEENYPRAVSYYKSKIPKTDVFDPQNTNSHSYSANNWKLRKNPLEEIVTRSSVKQLKDPKDTDASYISSTVSGQVRSLTNEEILRDLTGI